MSIRQVSDIDTWICNYFPFHFIYDSHILARLYEVVGIAVSLSLIDSYFPNIIALGIHVMLILLTCCH